MNLLRYAAAAAILLGAVAKLLHLPGANQILWLGLGLAVVWLLLFLPQAMKQPKDPEQPTAHPWDEIHNPSEKKE